MLVKFREYNKDHFQLEKIRKYFKTLYISHKGAMELQE